MKELNCIEKDIIEFMIKKSDEDRLTAIKFNDIIEKFTSCNYEYFFKEKNVCLLVPNDTNEDEYIKKGSRIIDICLLLQYLNENSYIFCLSRNNYYNNGRLGNEKIENYQSIKLDSKITNIVIQYIDCFIFISLSLKDFTKKFKTTEQIRHEEQIKKANHAIIVSWLAFIVAFITLLCTIRSNFINNTSDKIDYNAIDTVTEINQ